MPDFSAETTYRLRTQVSIPKLLECGDVAHWWCTHISECMPTAVIHSPLPPAGTEPAPDARVMNITAPTRFGELALKDFLAHPQSGARAIIVVKGGKIVAESYPDLRPDQPHL